MTFSKIECFLTAAETLNFTEAASRLFITQPVLSRQISSMEKELGLTLFSRSKKLSLTKAGESLAKDLKKIWHDYQSAILAARSVETSTIRTFRIGIYDGQTLLNDPRLTLLKKYRESTPDIEYVFSKNSISNSSKMLIDGSLDLVLGCSFDYADNDIFDVFTLCRTRSFIVVSKNHPLADLEHPSLKDFQNEKIIVPDETESPNCKRDLAACFRRAGLHPPTFVTVPDIGTRTLWLTAGEGIVIETSRLELWGNNSFAFVDVPEVASIPVSLICKKGNKKVSELLQFVGAHSSELEFVYPDSNY